MRVRLRSPAARCARRGACALLGALALTLLTSCRVPCGRVPEPFARLCRDRTDEFDTFDECYDRCIAARVPQDTCYERCMAGGPGRR